jgi:hypothetical protein
MNQEPLIENPMLTRRGFLLAAAGVGALAFLDGCSSNPGRNRVTPSSNNPSLPEIVPDSNDPQLMLLEEYEHETAVAPLYIDFTGFPQNHQEALKYAAAMAGDLQEWHKSGVQPLIIMEPTFNDGQDNMNLVAFSKGNYDEPLNTYFDTLAGLGITGEEMGTWVPFPEPNIPEWRNNDTGPELFTHNVTKVGEVIKNKFPNAKVSIMLNSQTSHDSNWSDVTLNPKALLSYVSGFPSGLIDSFGLQGFTWSNEDSPATFLSAQTAILGAKQLGVKHVWFITGTYSELNNPNGGGIIKSDNQRRAKVLNGVLNQALIAQAAGYMVDYINIFGENKLENGPSGAGSANYRYATPEAMNMLREFVDEAKLHNIPVAIFDDANDL